MTRTFNDNWAVRLVGTPGTWAAAAVYTDFVNMIGYRRCAFVVGNSELDADMDITVYEATDAEGSDAQAIAGLTDDFVDGTDETRAGIIEVRDDDLSDGFSYVGLLVTPGAANTFCAFALLGEAYQNPVSNGTEDGVAWIVGE